MSCHRGAERENGGLVERTPVVDDVDASLGAHRDVGGVATALAATLDVLGVSVRVEVAEPAASRVAELLADHARTERPPQRVLRLSHEGVDRWALHDGDLPVRDAMSPAGGVAMLLWSLNRVAMTTAHHVVLHAGCVAHKNAGIVLSGPMEAGKSTLVTALVRDGWAYLSDEIAAVSLEDGRLYPYPCPIALDPGSFPLFPMLEPDTSPLFGDTARWHLSSDTVRPGSRSAPVTAAALVFPRFEPGAPCTLRPVSATTALRLLMGQAFNLRVLGGEGFAALAELVRRVPRYELTLDNLDGACQTLRRLSLQWLA